MVHGFKQFQLAKQTLLQRVIFCFSNYFYCSFFTSLDELCFVDTSKTSLAEFLLKLVLQVDIFLKDSHELVFFDSYSYGTLTQPVTDHRGSPGYLLRIWSLFYRLLLFLLL